jgi:hypothetical protein
MASLVARPSPWFTGGVSHTIVPSSVALLYCWVMVELVYTILQIFADIATQDSLSSGLQVYPHALYIALIAAV